MKNNNKQRLYKYAAAAIVLFPMPVFAEWSPVKSSLDNPVVQIFVIVIAVLALCIGLLANVLMGAAQFKIKQAKEEREKQNSITAKVTGLCLLLFAGNTVFAADAPAATGNAVSDTIGGMSSTSFYALLCVVLVELIIMLVLLYNVRFLLKVENTSAVILKESKKINWLKYWDKFNSLRPLKEESQIDLGHNYDGIRELDNRLPPWWLYGFYACIVFAVIYLWQHEVSHSAASSLDEYNMAMKQGEEDKENYLKNAANKVDENSVKYLADETNLASGKAIFTTVCAACHSADGGGLVGPNLTDNYWLHGGSIKDIFKTIKYGWQEKGMKSWKDDYTPVQMAQLASYVKSLQGKTPLKAKEPQGVPYTEEEKNPNDSLKNSHDSLKIVPMGKKMTTASL